ncbi:MAG TPA: anti-sigma regulatory factor [Bacteroidota bacterium]|nr:anti-sigma regulatory factor [Bacteroidota bacterium]
MLTEVRVQISSDADIVISRQKGRALAVEIGFTQVDLTLITTAISELTRNIVEYAKKGEVIIRSIHSGTKHGIEIVAHDDGPGIADVALAMQDGYSSRNSLGLGLPGTKRLMDEFDITSRLGAGTTVKIKKWIR